MPGSPKEIFESYVYAGTFSRDADAVAALFTEDGVFEAPFAPADGILPRYVAGREEIRRAMAAYYEHQADDGLRAPNPEKSGYVLHTTADPDVFIAEIDAVFDGPAPAPGHDGSGHGGPGHGGSGPDVTVSLVQIFRIREGKIARLRDYFAPEHGAR